MPDKQPAPPIELLTRFVTRSGSHWLTLISILIAGGLFALAITLIPLVVGQLFTQILPGGNRQLMQSLPLILMILLLAAIFADWVVYYVLERLLGRAILDIRTELFKKLLALPPACSDFPAETISLYFFQSIEKLGHNVSLLGVCLSRDLLTAAGLLGVMAWLNSEMSLLVLAMLATIFFIGQIFRANARQQDMLGQKQYEVSRCLSKALRLNRIIHLDKGYKQEIRHTRNSFEQLQSFLQKQFRQTKLMELLAYVLLIGVLTASLYYLLQQLASNQLTAGDAAAFFMAGAMLIFPLQRLFSINLLLKQCSEALQVIFPLLNQDSRIVEENPYTTQFRRGKGKLRFEGVSFRGGATECQLPHFNLEIASGQKIALINRDANINRLFADLVCGFVQPSTGRILLDDNDTKRINPAELCSYIAWIAADEDLLGDTVAINIAYGSACCSREIAITTAAHASQAMEFIRKLPQGLQTKINQPALIFSDDQRQRILIARALLKNPSIIILDETTACFNTDNTALLQALQVLLNNRTVLILSSRPVMLNLAGQQFDPEKPALISACHSDGCTVR